MSKCIKINSAIIDCWTEKEFNRLPLGISSNINCPKKLQRKYYGIFNKDNMSALNNYAQKENIHIFFKELNNDFFHNSSMTVFSKSANHNNKEYKTPLNLNIDTKENFVKSVRDIYKKVEEAVKNFTIKKTDK